MNGNTKTIMAALVVTLGATAYAGPLSQSLQGSSDSLAASGNAVSTTVTLFVNDTSTSLVASGKASAGAGRALANGTIAIIETSGTVAGKAYDASNTLALKGSAESATLADKGSTASANSAESTYGASKAVVTKTGEILSMSVAKTGEALATSGRDTVVFLQDTSTETSTLTSKAGRALKRGFVATVDASGTVLDKSGHAIYDASGKALQLVVDGSGKVVEVAKGSTIAVYNGAKSVVIQVKDDASAVGGWSVAVVKTSALQTSALIEASGEGSKNVYKSLTTGKEY